MRGLMDGAGPERRPREHAAPPTPSSAGQVLALQRTAGNAVVGAVIRQLRLGPHSPAVQRACCAGCAPTEGSEGADDGPALQRLTSWPDATSKNAARRSVLAFERWPVHGLAEGNQSPRHPNIPVSSDPEIEKGNVTNRARIAQHAGNSVEKADKRAIVYIPTAFSPASQPETPTPAVVSGGIDVVFHLHGFNPGWRQNKTTGTTRDESEERIPDQLPPTMVAVLPQGTELSGFGSLDVDAMAKGALTLISAAWGSVPIRRVVLGGHSGGGGAVSRILAMKLAKNEKLANDPASHRAKRKLPTGLSEVVLFDGINGSGQEAIVELWVLDSIKEDVAALAGLAGNPAQAVFTDTSMRFRAFFTPGDPFYQPTHLTLKGAIAKALDDKKKPPGVPQAVWDKLKLNYQVIEAAKGTQHDDEVSGKHTNNGVATFDDHLKTALGALTPGGKAPVVPAPPKPSCPLPQPKTTRVLADPNAKKALVEAGPPGSGALLLGALVPAGGGSCLLAGPRPTLRRGDSGQAVGTLQTELNFTGTRPALVEDTRFGRLTAAAVVEFQKRESLAADGIVGAKTWERLDALVDAPGETGAGDQPGAVAGGANATLAAFAPVLGAPIGQAVPGGNVAQKPASLPITGVPLATPKGRFLRFASPAAHSNATDRPQFQTNASKVVPYTGTGAAGAQIHPSVNAALGSLLSAMRTVGAAENDESLKQASVGIGFRPSSASEGALYLGALRKTIKLSPGVFGQLVFPTTLEAEAVSELGFTGSARHRAFRDKIAVQPNWTPALAKRLVDETAKFKAPRGGSTHHSGVVVDINFPYAVSATQVLSHDTKRERNAEALRSGAGVWLNANAPSFGFDSYNTGVEIWHQEWRRWRGTAADPASPPSP